jgi:hypothetical protein
MMPELGLGSHGMKILSTGKIKEVSKAQHRTK